jgi:hypothetical protein
MNLKDCIGFSDSGTFTTKSHSGGYLGNRGEGIGGKELWLWLWSPDWNATWRRKGLLPYAGQLSVHCRRADLSVVCGLLRLDSSRCSAARGVHIPRLEQWIVGEMTWIYSCLLKTSFSNAEFVVAGDVKRSAGGSTTTCWKGYSAN